MMRIHKQFKEFALRSSSLALTIGIFDGVHLGHQALLKRLKQVAPQTAVITFSNHPTEVLRDTGVTYLTTLSHRLALFERLGIDDTLLIPFSKEFSEQIAENFLITVQQSIPFTHLILGHDALIGHDRQNDLRDVARKLGFSLEYLKPVHVEGHLVSSSEIRQHIRAGNLEAASRLLGRPYSIYATVVRGQGKGGLLGFHTANLPVETLALPPLGVYAALVKIKDETYSAVANLGHAPTLHQDRPTCLEVHLIDTHKELYDQHIEVLFLKYLRPEKRFPSPEALKLQIAEDILECGNYLPPCN